MHSFVTYARGSACVRCRLFIGGTWFGYLQPCQPITGAA